MSRRAVDPLNGRIDLIDRRPERLRRLDQRVALDLFVEERDRIAEGRRQDRLAQLIPGIVRPGAAVELGDVVGADAALTRSDDHAEIVVEHDRGGSLLRDRAENVAEMRKKTRIFRAIDRLGFPVGQILVLREWRERQVVAVPERRLHQDPCGNPLFFKRVAEAGEDLRALPRFIPDRIALGDQYHLEERHRDHALTVQIDDIRAPLGKMIVF